MQRIQAKFQQLQQAHKKALIPYITAGDPYPDITVPLLHSLVAAGADILEVGMPFSDPMAEGPVIQAAHERALAQGTNLATVFEQVRAFRQQDKDTPIVLMGYLNPIEQMGYHQFVTAAQQAGVDGLLIVDLPPEEADDLLTELARAQIDPIFLLSPTTTPARIQLIVQHAKGYHYYVSMTGVTGAKGLDLAAVASKLNTIRQYVKLPLAVGFGIQDAASAAAIGALADAVIVGSALVKRIAAVHGNDPATYCTQASNFIQELRVALDRLA